MYSSGSSNFLVSEAKFSSFKNDFKFEVVEFCFVSKRISRCLYYVLELLETNPDNAYLVTIIGKCFNEMYSNQKEHTLNRIVDLPSPYADKNYDVLTQFIQNINLNNMASLGFYFLNSYKTKMAGNAFAPQISRMIVSPKAHPRRKSQSAQTATAALKRPKNAPVRISPSCGTNSSGNAIDTASAPR